MTWFLSSVRPGALIDKQSMYLQGDLCVQILHQNGEHVLLGLDFLHETCSGFRFIAWVVLTDHISAGFGVCKKKSL